MKQPMQDMIPNEKRTIRRIPIDKTKRKMPLMSTAPKKVKEPVASVDEMPETPQPVQPSKPPTVTSSVPDFPIRGGGSKRSVWKWAVGVVVVLLVLFFIFSLIFGGATVTAEPRHENISVDGQFAGVIAEKATIGDLPFEIMTINKVRSKEVEATGEEQVNTKASGRIIVFNDFDDNIQRLINNTRFETPEGLVYRIPESIVVPGQTTDSNGDTIPGSIEVEVFADEAGSEYNVGLKDFTIPGFDGDPRFFKFFARSKTQMTGGFSGTQKTVREVDEDRAREELQTELLDVLMSEAASETPEGFVFFESLTFVSFEQASQVTTDDDDTVGIQEEGTLQAIIFNKADLSEFIAEQTIGTYSGSPVMLEDIGNLTASIVDKDLVDRTSIGALDITFSGNGEMVWTFDQERLKADLSGKSRTETDMVLSGYPSIERAEIVLRPFWKRSFPDDTGDIEVEIKLGEE